MTLICDLDGTLINSEHPLKTIETEVKNELGIKITFEEQIRRFGGVGLSQQLEMDPSIPKEFLDICEHRFKECGPSVLKPNPGVTEFLESWSGPMCIASNGPEFWILFALECTDLLRYFDKKNIFHIGLVEKPKPAPDLFLLAAEKMNADKQEALIIEDSLVGITAAKAAGIKAIAYTGCSNLNPELLIEAGASSTFNDFQNFQPS